MLISPSPIRVLCPSNARIRALLPSGVALVFKPQMPPMRSTRTPSPYPKVKKMKQWTWHPHEMKAPASALQVHKPPTPSHTVKSSSKNVHLKLDPRVHA